MEIYTAYLELCVIIRWVGLCIFDADEVSFVSKVDKIKINVLWISVGYLAMLAFGYFDSIRYPLIPVFSQVFSVNYAHSSLFMACGYYGSIISCLFLLKLVYRYSLKTITMIVLLGTLIVCLCAGIITEYRALVLYGTIYGAFITSLNSLSTMIILNNTPAHLSGKYISGAQALYGLSCICVPWIVAKIFTSGIGWRWCFYVITPLVVFILVITLISTLKDRNKLKLEDVKEVKENKKKTVVSSKLSALEKVSVFVLAIYVVGEVVGVAWMPTILIEKYGFTVDSCKIIVTLFFVLFTISRFSCVKISSPSNEKNIILTVLLLCVISFILGGYLNPWFFIGFGLLAPVFPLFMANLSRRDPPRTNAITLWVLICTQTILGVLTFVLGKIIDTLGVNIAIIISPIILILTMIGVFRVIPSSKNLQ